MAGLKKGKFETIHVFYNRWKLAYKAFTEAGNNRLTEAEKIEFFNAALDENFGDYVKDMYNKEVTGDRTVPDTLEANYNCAANYLSSSSGIVTDSRAVYFTGDQLASQFRKQQKTKATEDKAVFVAAKEEVTNDKPAKKRLSREDWLAKQACHHCHALGHLMKNCPNIDSAVEEVKAEQVDSAAVAPKKNHKPKKVNACRMLAWISTVPSKFLVAMDDCAHYSVACNKDFLSDIVYGKCAPLLNWNGEAHANEASGSLHPFGYCELDESAPINLLSEFEIRSRFRVDEIFADDSKVGNPLRKIVRVGAIDVILNLTLIPGNT